MCTFIIAWQVFPDTPVVVAANRDEQYDRPSSPPTRWETNPTIIAPRDEKAGGTWIGYNGAGVLASLTNRWTDTDLLGDRSRGQLVVDVLEYESAETAVRTVERTINDHEYAGFNLVIADHTTGFLLEWDGRLRITPFTPGIHVVVNVGADSRFTIPESRVDAGERQATNADRARTTLQPEPGESVTEWLERARETLRDHDYGFCVHGDGFGTRSSSIITMGVDGSVTYEFADGPPCETEHHPVDAARNLQE